MHKLKLDNLKVESFATGEGGTTKREGTVRGHAGTGAVTYCGATCGVSCFIAETCQASCDTCYYSCLHNTCDFTCFNTCWC